MSAGCILPQISLSLSTVIHLSYQSVLTDLSIF